MSLQSSPIETKVLNFVTFAQVSWHWSGSESIESILRGLDRPTQKLGVHDFERGEEWWHLCVILCNPRTTEADWHRKGREDGTTLQLYCTQYSIIAQYSNIAL